MKTLRQVIEKMDKINPHDTEYEYNKLYFYENDEWYKKILERAIKLKAKRVIDVGSNYNVHGYMFENEGIDYVGIEQYLKKGHKPYTSKKVKFINKDYYDIREQFSEEIIISNLCIGYLIPIEDVLAKHLITGALDTDGKCIAKIIF